MSATSPSIAQPAQAGGEEIPRWIHRLVRLTSHLWSPFALYRKAPMPISDHLVPLGADDVQRLSDAMRERLATNEHALATLGFSPPFRGANHAIANIRACFSLVEHPKDGALAFVLVTQGAHVGTSAVVTFRTDFADGWHVYTSNGGMIPRTPNRPQIDGVRFAGMQDVRELYELHRFRVAERARGVPTVSLTRGNEPLAFQAQESREVHDFWVRAGYYDLVDGPALRFTVKGAILASWRGLFPWKQITTWRNAAKASAILGRARRG
jgi:hypothetical protein